MNCSVGQYTESIYDQRICSAIRNAECPDGNQN